MVEGAWTKREGHSWGWPGPQAVTGTTAFPSPGARCGAVQRAAGETMARLFSPRPPPSEDLFYETYYSLSQQYPLLLLLLVIVLCALLALLAVAWASGRVSGASTRAAARGSLPRGHFRSWDLWGSSFRCACFLC